MPTRAAYLDLTDPDLAALAAELAAAGVRRAVVVPLLFTDAFHARIDVPDAVTQAADSSGVELVLGPILGTGDDVVDVVAARLAAAGTPSGAPVLLYAVGSSRPEANAAVAGLADRLAVRRGTAGPGRLRHHRAAGRRRAGRARRRRATGRARWSRCSSLPGCCWTRSRRPSPPRAGRWPIRSARCWRPWWPTATARAWVPADPLR